MKTSSTQIFNSIRFGKDQQFFFSIERKMKQSKATLKSLDPARFFTPVLTIAANRSVV